MKHLLKRLALILFGYALASIASGIVVALVYDSNKVLGAQGLPAAFGLCAVISLFIAVYAALPALVVVIVAEIRRIHIWIYYAITGCLIGASLPLVVEMKNLVPTGILFGPIAGLIYWWVSGRRAGLRPPSEP